MDSVIEPQTYSIGAKKISSSFLSKTMFRLASWANNNFLSVGVFAIFAGIMNKSLLEVDFAGMIPFASDISVVLGIVLSILGIGLKAIEFKKYFKSRKTKTRGRQQRTKRRIHN